jgi:hypothetical protein
MKLLHVVSQEEMSPLRADRESQDEHFLWQYETRGKLFQISLIYDTIVPPTDISAIYC